MVLDHVLQQLLAHLLVLFGRPIVHPAGGVRRDVAWLPGAWAFVPTRGKDPLSRDTEGGAMEEPLDEVGVRVAGCVDVRLDEGRLNSGRAQGPRSCAQCLKEEMMDPLDLGG